jgi:hypothetical protein
MLKGVKGFVALFLKGFVALFLKGFVALFLHLWTFKTPN